MTRTAAGVSARPPAAGPGRGRPGVPALVAVAHGSRDPAAVRTVRALLAAVRALRPEVPVRLGHVELNEPLLADTLEVLAREGGEAVLVPLLFGRGHHVTRDIPETLAAAEAGAPGPDAAGRRYGAGPPGPAGRPAAGSRPGPAEWPDAARVRDRATPAEGGPPGAGSRPATADRPAAGQPGAAEYAPVRPFSARVAAPLGPHPLLADALAARLAEAGWRGGDGVVLAAAGSRAARSAADTEATAALLAARLGVPVLPAYASAAAPTVAEAARTLAARGRRRIGVACCFTAPGLFARRTAADAAALGLPVAAPLGAHPALARLVLHRYDEQLAARRGAVRTAA